eukprot:403349951
MDISLNPAERQESINKRKSRDEKKAKLISKLDMNKIRKMSSQLSAIASDEVINSESDESVSDEEASVEQSSSQSSSSIEGQIEEDDNDSLSSDEDTHQNPKKSKLKLKNKMSSLSIKEETKIKHTDQKPMKKTRFNDIVSEHDDDDSDNSSVTPQNKTRSKQQNKPVKYSIDEQEENSVTDLSNEEDNKILQDEENNESDNDSVESLTDKQMEQEKQDKSEKTNGYGRGKKRKRKSNQNEGRSGIMRNSLTKEDYSFYYENSVWDQYEDFVYAIQRGKTDKVIITAKKEGISNEESLRPSGDTILHVCAEYGHEKLFQYFVTEMRADYMVRNYADETPFHLAAREGKLNIMQMYLDSYQFDIDHETIDGWSALQYASINGFISAIEVLHRFGASMNIVDKLKRSALHWACKFNQLEVAQVLLRLGIQSGEGGPNSMRDYEGNKPIDIAKDKGYMELVQLINQHQINVQRRKLQLKQGIVNTVNNAQNQNHN